MASPTQDAPSMRPTHPLAAWRMTQRVWDPGKRESRPMTIADAARKFSDFVGRKVPYQTWMYWENYPDEGGRMPGTENMEALMRFTNLQVRSDHFYQIEEIRKQIAQAREAEEAADAGA